MKKCLFILSVFFLMTVFDSQTDAQLINYGRRNKFLRATNPDMTEEESIPQWARELVEPQSTEERRFDTNRDGRLQSAEVKVYLRGIIEQVEDRGYVSAVTDLLREYDRNRDGMINASELERMKEHVK